MSIRNWIALAFIVASFICLYPGLVNNMMTLKVGAQLPLLGNIELYEATQSILETIENLFKEKNYLVAWLILLFSVVVPLLKTLMLLAVILFPKFNGRSKMMKLVSAIGKWSMADVFVVSIFMAYLATASNEAVSATLHSGYYYFTAYCILSIFGTQIIDLNQPSHSKVIAP